MADVDRENPPLSPEEANSLEAFFAAARAEEPRLSDALVAAILADAAAAAPARPVVVALPRRRAWRPSDRWQAAVALAAAAALGFWIGLAGHLEIIDPTVWTGIGLTETAADPVAGFYDLAAVEN